MLNRVLKGFSDRLSADPFLFTLLRRIPENNFVGEKRVIAREIGGAAGGLLLDLGCGTGEFCRRFAPEGYLGLDLNRPYLRYARARHPRYLFLQADGAAVPLPDGACAWVLVAGVFHHLPPEISLALAREIRRVLKPDGRALVMEDSRSTGRFNLVGRLVHRLDQGEFIRHSASYEEILIRFFRILQSYHMRSGVCEYEVFVLTPIINAADKNSR